VICSMSDSLYDVKSTTASQGCLADIKKDLECKLTEYRSDLPKPKVVLPVPKHFGHFVRGWLVPIGGPSVECRHIPA
jgi:hypothetical protein